MRPAKETPMKNSGCTLAVLIACLASGNASAQSGAAEKKPDAKKMAEMQKSMEAMQAYATPGPQHEKLKRMTGTWDAAVKFWFEPGSEAQEVAGKAEMKMILADHYLQQEFSGQMMGQPFTGIGLLGYDNARKKYQSFWIDSMSTGFYSGEGTADKDGNLTFQSSSTDPMTKKVVKGRDVWTFDGDGRFVFESYGPAPRTGKMFKTLEITYTKK
jgi:hypothetical protein